MEQQKREQFISNYIKRQEELLFENIRSRIEAEVNSSIRALEIQQMEETIAQSQKKSLQDNDDILNQMKNQYEETINLIRADMEAEKNLYEQKAASHLAAIIEVRDERTRLANDIQTYKNNYDAVNNAHNQLIATSKQDQETYTCKISDLSAKKMAAENDYSNLKIEHEKLLIKYKENIELLEKSKKKQTFKKTTDWEDSSIIN